MQDLLGFDKMVTPIIIRVLYFIGLIGVVIAAVVSLFSGSVSGILTAIGILVFGAITVRVYSELLILLFRIHDNLVSINQQMKDRNSSGL